MARVRSVAAVCALVAVLVACGSALAAGPLPVGSVTHFTIPTANSVPFGIAAGPDGNMWFTEFQVNQIGRITPTGQITEFTLPTANSGPSGIAAGPDGNMWVAEAAGRIGRITLAGQITEFAVPTFGSEPTAIAAGPDGNMWFTESGASQIGRITPAGQVTEFAIPTAKSGPSGIAAGPDGNLWFTEESNKIGRITPAGQVTEFTVPTANSSPNAIAAGPDGNMWFTEGTGNKIGRITPVGQVTEFTIPTATSTPEGIAAGPDGDMLFTELDGGQVGRVTPAGQITEFPVTNGEPIGIAAGPDGNMWFAEFLGNKIGQIGIGVRAASVRAPRVTGSGQQGTQQVCQGDVWAQWAGQPPSYGALSSDGYQWLRDGSAIAGATSQAYTPVGGDVGHVLSCEITVTYPVLDVTTAATSAGVMVLAQSSGAQGPTGPAGAAGQAGAKGPAGQIELVTCKQVTVTVKHKRVKRTKCTTRLVSKNVKFTTATASAASASITRGRVVYARGRLISTRHGATKLMLTPARTLKPGSYTLITSAGRHAHRTQIRIG